MIKVGIIGFGFIGKMHLSTLRRTGLAEVVAVADKVPANLSGEAGAGGNIAASGGGSNLEGVQTYPDGDALLRDNDADAVLIALPTYLHAEYVRKALAAGKHVICEKPLALNVTEGAAIVAAADKADTHLFVAHCIRFWPAYEKAEAFIRDRTYGQVRRAHFWRTSPKPTWSWESWLMDESRGGGCLLDLHIHDVDYVNHVFGIPSFVRAAGIRSGKEGVGDVMATYTYEDGKVVTLEGGWEQHAAYPFRMGFRIVFEEATLEHNSLVDRALNVYGADGRASSVALPEEDGYGGEHRYFFGCIGSGRRPARVTPRSSLEALELVEWERKSMNGGGQYRHALA